MSQTERRIDPYTQRSVLVSPGRGGVGRGRLGGLPTPAGRCPFCPGHEADTETTISRRPEHGDWAVRVVSNIYPVVAESSGDAAGAHEVVIECREHDADIADYGIDHVEQVLAIWRERVRALESNSATLSTLVFRNRGRGAGSSQPHPHTQIVATSWVPSEVAIRWRIAQAYFDEHGESLHAAEIRRELPSTRLIAADDIMATFCPYAPSRAFELRFAPREPRGGFATATDEQVAALASHLSDGARRLREHTSIDDYNLVLRQPPARQTGPAAAWHLELLPRTGGDAGFELSSGEMIVVVTPEKAAEQLRG